MAVRVITHGNNGFRSSQLLNKIPASQGNEVYTTDEFVFLPFSDLDLNRRFPLFHPNPEMEVLVNQSEEDVEVSAILVLISLTEVFSEGMHSLIIKIPHNQFYGFNETNVKQWWKRVIVVFSFGQYGGDDKRVREMIAKNRGIKEIVEKAGNRHIHVSDNTTPGEFAHRLRGILTASKMKKLNIFKDRANHEETQVLLEQQSSQKPRLTPRCQKTEIFLVAAMILMVILFLLVTTAFLAVIICTTTKPSNDSSFCYALKILKPAASSSN